MLDARGGGQRGFDALSEHQPGRSAVEGVDLGPRIEQSALAEDLVSVIVGRMVGAAGTAIVVLHAGDR